MTADVTTDILVVGSGAAGMYAAISASRDGADTVLVDKSLIGRGGATIMAQMTVAAAIGEQEPDHWTHHLRDTIESGRRLCNEELASALCEDAPSRIRELEDWKIGWAREGIRIKQVMAPGHHFERCVYVDFLNTGPAVAKTLRRQVGRQDHLRRAGELAITNVVVEEGQVVGAVGHARVRCSSTIWTVILSAISRGNSVPLANASVRTAGLRRPDIPGIEVCVIVDSVTKKPST